MIAIEFDSTQTKRLNELAVAEGREPSDLVRQIVEDYLELRYATPDPPEAWAAASAALAPEVVEPEHENWDSDQELKHGSG